MSTKAAEGLVERLCVVDLYWIFNDMGINLVRVNYHIPEGERFPPEAENDPFFLSFSACRNSFEEQFKGFFATWDEWSAVFNTEGGASRWWGWFCTTEQFAYANLIITKMKLLLLKHGIDPNELAHQRLVKKSIEYDQLLADIWLLQERQSSLLSQSDGWLSLRLVGLTLP